MIRPAPLLLAAALVGALAPPAFAAPLDLPGGCAVATQSTLRAQGQGGFEATVLEVSVPGLAGPATLRAQRLRADASDDALRPEQLRQAATAAAAALLAEMGGRHGGCPDAVLEAASAPLARGVGHGGRYSFDWQDVSVRAGDMRLGARRLSLQLAGDGANARLTATLDGVVSNAAAAALAPEALALRATLPASELPALISGAAGRAAPVALAIERLDARRGGSTLSGQGTAVVAATPQDSEAQGHVAVRGLDALLDAAAGLPRLRTALFLAKLVAHRQGDRAEWDLGWQAGTLLVNGVPLPLR